MSIQQSIDKATTSIVKAASVKPVIEAAKTLKEQVADTMQDYAKTPKVPQAKYDEDMKKMQDIGEEYSEGLTKEIRDIYSDYVRGGAQLKQMNKANARIDKILQTRAFQKQALESRVQRGEISDEDLLNKVNYDYIKKVKLNG